MIGGRNLDEFGGGSDHWFGCINRRRTKIDVLAFE